MKERQKELGIKGLSPEEVAADSSLILEWLKGTGASKVVIHLDIDVIDPADMIAGVGIERDENKRGSTCHQLHWVRIRSSRTYRRRTYATDSD